MQAGIPITSPPAGALATVWEYFLLRAFVSFRFAFLRERVEIFL